MHLIMLRLKVMQKLWNAVNIAMFEIIIHISSMKSIWLFPDHLGLTMYVWILQSHLLRFSTKPAIYCKLLFVFIGVFIQNIVLIQYSIMSRYIYIIESDTGCISYKSDKNKTFVTSILFTTILHADISIYTKLPSISTHLK